ncbi:epoxide hydrolase N-termina [Exidia glandulosa HHB12029]|uniref:Epoxide hydrolase N-termina n=1 Tax=Exidia glandulosa HHB12029 TaxID=1314781 RepID=A0A165IFZ6_EXIGL|nr:epoxide hydrolase N-termina [Exidia glandulosa HHB12029]
MATRPPNSRYKAVVFDIGGVVVGSPFLGIAAYERAHGLPRNYINCLITAYGENGAYQRFERGEIGLKQFYDVWGRELNNVERGNAAYNAYCAKRSLPPPAALPSSLKIDARDLFGQMMRQAATMDAGVVRAIQRIRARGMRTIALTNNYSKEDEGGAHAPDAHDRAHLGWEEGAVPTRIRELFDDWVDSSTEGLRKPDPEFFLLACRRNGIRPDEVIFLDDIGANLKAAAQLGMTTIHVPLEGSARALKTLGEKLGFDVTSLPAAKL